MAERRVDALSTVVKAALAEAQSRGDRRLGTDHLMLGLLRDSDSLATRALGVELDSAHEALDALDSAALSAIGVDVGDLRAARLVPSRQRPPLTSAARSVLHQAVREAADEKVRRPTAKHLLLALLSCQRPDPAAELMTQLRVEPSDVRRNLGRSEP